MWWFNVHNRRIVKYISVITVILCPVILATSADDDGCYVILCPVIFATSAEGDCYFIILGPVICATSAEDDACCGILVYVYIS